MNIEGCVVLVTGANRGIGAEWVRQLRERGASKIYAQVMALHEGPVTTPMGDNFPIGKINPDQVVTAALDGLEKGLTEVVVDDVTRFVKSTLTEDPSRYAAILGGGK